MLVDRIEQPRRPLNIRLERIDECREAVLREALCGEVKYVIRCSIRDSPFDRGRIAQIAVDQEYPITRIYAWNQRLDVCKRAAPSAQADDIPIGVCDQIFRKVRPHH